MDWSFTIAFSYRENTYKPPQVEMISWVQCLVFIHYDHESNNKTPPLIVFLNDNQQE